MLLQGNSGLAPGLVMFCARFFLRPGPAVLVLRVVLVQPGVVTFFQRFAHF